MGTLPSIPLPPEPSPPTCCSAPTLPQCCQKGEKFTGHKENQRWVNIVLESSVTWGLSVGTHLQESCLHHTRCSGNNVFAFAILVPAFPPSQAVPAPRCFLVFHPHRGVLWPQRSQKTEPSPQKNRSEHQAAENLANQGLDGPNCL